MNEYSDVGSNTPSSGNSSCARKFHVTKLLPPKEAPLCLTDIHILETNDFKTAIEKDINSLPAPHIDETRLFENILIPYKYLWGGYYSLAVDAWEVLLKVIKDINHSRFEAMHKGTPYYFCGIAAFKGKDYERAVFYFDAALQEDAKNYDILRKTPPAQNLPEYPEAPAALFLTLDDNIKDQTAIELTGQIKVLMEDSLERFRKASASDFDLTKLQKCFLKKSIEDGGLIKWRSAATALLSYVLESETRKKEFSIRSAHGGTMEPFFLHLFKGCLLFETLLKINLNVTKQTLDKLLDKTTRKNLGINTDDIYKTPVSGVEFEKVVSENKNWRTNGTPFNERIVWTAYGIRNTTGHSLAWPDSLSYDNFKGISEDVLFSNLLVLDKLFNKP